METRTRTVEVEDVKIAGEWVRLAHLIDFLREVEGTKSVFGMTPQPEHRDVIDALKDTDVIDSRANGAVFVADEEAREDLHERAIEEYTSD